MARQLWLLRRGSMTLADFRTAKTTYSSSVARSILKLGERESPGRIVLSGSIRGDLKIDFPLSCAVVITGDIHGDVVVTEPIAGDVAIVGGIDGRFIGRSVIAGNLELSGKISHGLHLTGRIDGSISVTANFSEDVYVACSVAGNLRIQGSIQTASNQARGGNLELSERLHVAGAVEIDLQAYGNIRIDSHIEGLTLITGATTGQLEFGSRCLIGGQLRLLGTSSSIALSGSFEERVLIAPSSGATIPIRTLSGAHFYDEVEIGDRIRLDNCDFRGCTGIGNLNLSGNDLFPDGVVLANPPSASNSKLISPKELTVIYRNLRVGMEDRGSRPAAAGFYVGEMNARLALALSQPGWGRYRFDTIILGAYKAISGYGQRPARASMWFIITTVIGTILFAIGGVNLWPSYPVDQDSVLEGWTNRDRALSVLFTLRSMVSFFSAPEAKFSALEGYLQFGLRFVGPILLAQIVLSARERVIR